LNRAASPSTRPAFLDLDQVLKNPEKLCVRVREREAHRVFCDLIGREISREREGERVCVCEEGECFS
jgi:hypothetical protein